MLYLNDENYDPIADAGQLRLHFDGGGDELPPRGASPRYVDVDPEGGKLVLFRSELIPHEVLNTNAERFVLVGWFNRGVSAADIGRLGGVVGEADGVARAGWMAVAMATYGVANIMGQ